MTRKTLPASISRLHQARRLRFCCVRKNQFRAEQYLTGKPERQHWQNERLCEHPWFPRRELRFCENGASAESSKASQVHNSNWLEAAMRDVVLVSSVRTPVGRAFKGTLRATRPDELAAIAIKGALDCVPQLDPKEIEDVILGCAMPEAEQGMNVARIASLRAGLPVETAAVTINRFCSSGLQAIAMAAERIMAGGADVVIAGGAESMSMIPMGGNKISPNPWLVDHYPDAY